MNGDIIIDIQGIMNKEGSTVIKSEAGRISIQANDITMAGR